MKKKTFTAGKLGLAVLGVILFVLLVYALYVILTYHRIEDRQILEINSSAADLGPVRTGETYSIISYNIGFGAYTPDFSFFMDGGKSSVAKSRESVRSTVEGAARLARELDPDFAIFEEVDLDSTRSHHVDEQALIGQAFPEYACAFAINYDSAFLMVPPWEPHGKSLSGIGFYSKYQISSSLRRSLPISTDFHKFLDLDRCYTVSRIPVENGKTLCIYSVHLSAYGNNAEIRKSQITMLAEDMKTEREAGNYVVCGGDFNHDLIRQDLSEESTFSWAYPFPREYLPEGFTLATDALTKEEREGLSPSTRNADVPYTPGSTLTLTVDGFLFSDNIAFENFQVIDTQFQYSDHNPVVLEFRLTQEKP